MKKKYVVFVMNTRNFLHASMQDKNSIVCNVKQKLLKNMEMITGNHVHLGIFLKVGPRKLMLLEKKGIPKHQTCSQA